MAYRYRSRRSARRLARRSRRNFIITLLLVGILIYATIQWVLPSLINSIGFIQSIIKPPKKVVSQENPSLAPPVLNIPYEATNTSQINIAGYVTTKLKVSIYVDDELKGSTESLEDGSFELKDISLSLGTNNIFGKTSDERGESLPSKLIKVIYDNEKPPLEISEPEDGKNIQGERKLKISGKTENNSIVFINNSQIILDKEGKFESIQTLNDGGNIFTIKAQDLAGNFLEISRRVVFQP